MKKQIPRQKVLKILGDYGCYFLSLIYIAEQITKKRFNAEKEFLRAKKAKSVDEECTVLNPDEILFHLTGRVCVTRKESKEYTAQEGEYEVLAFKDKFTHFVVGNCKPLVENGQENVVYDPLGESATVKNGAVESKRIIKVQ